MTLLVIGLISLVLLVIIGSVVLGHLAETKKIRERLGKAHPDSAVLMDHISEEQETTRAHISAQMSTKDHDGKTAQGLVYELHARFDALIKLINDFVRGIHK